MINLLPPKEKERIILGKNLRLVFILGVLAIVCLLSFWLLLTIINIQVNIQKENQFFLTKSEEEKVSQLQIVKGKISEVNHIILRINEFYDNQTYASDILIKISDVLGKDICLETFSFNKAENQVTFSGKVQDLGGLNNLRQVLQESDFKELEFSISTYIPEEDIDFKVRFKIKDEV